MREQTGVSLAPLTTLRVGGPARRYVVAETRDEIVAVVGACDAAGEPLLVLGGGSNVVVGDGGFDGTVLRIANRGWFGGAGSLQVDAGAPWEPIVARTVADGLAGIEALAGIPGSVGATPVQNVGAYGQEVADTVRVVWAYDRQERELRDLPAQECGFGYRTSRFKREAGRWVVVSVVLELLPGPLSTPVRYAELARVLGVAVGDRAPLADVAAAVLALRRGKGMVLSEGDRDTWSAGSFFTNPVLTADAAAGLRARVAADLGADVKLPEYPGDGSGSVKIPAAWLIERAGFARGHTRGRVAISGKHTLALTNRGGATTAELLDLARDVRDGVRAAFDVDLVPEPVLVNCTL